MVQNPRLDMSRTMVFLYSLDLRDFFPCLAIVPGCSDPTNNTNSGASVWP
jgi:hypothetical protein